MSKASFITAIDCAGGPLTFQNPKHYKPAILRLPSLIIVCLISFGFVGLLEFGSRTLPAGKKGEFSFPGILDKRQVLDPESSSIVEPTRPIPSAAPPDIYVPGTSAVRPSVYVPESSSVGGQQPLKSNTWEPAPPPPPSVYVPPFSSIGEQRPVSTLPPPPPVPVPSSSIYVPTAVSIPVPSPGAPAPGVYVQSTVVQVQTTIGSTTELVRSVSYSLTTNEAGKVTSLPVTITATTVKPLVSQVFVESVVGIKGGGVITFPLWKTFVANYLPVILATILEIIWIAIFAKVKLISPFIALSSPKGAKGSDSLFPYFVSSNLSLTPLISLLRGHWLFLWTSITFVAVSFLPALASEVIWPDTKYCPNPDLARPVNPCYPPRLTMDPLIVRVAQGLLTFVAIMTGAVAVLVMKSRTGIFADPSSIAGVATLVHHPETLRDFRSLHPEANDKALKAHIGKKRYGLRDYQTSEGVWRYGIVPLYEDGQIIQRKLSPDSGVPDYSYGGMEPLSPYEQWYKRQYAPCASDEALVGPNTKKRGNKGMQLFQDVVFLLFMLGVLGLVVAYFVDYSSSAFNAFFNSDGFGPRFIMTLIGSVLASNWNRLQRRTQTITPFRVLSLSPPPSARRSILLRVHGLPITSIIPLLASRHLIPAFISLVTMLSDVLVITLSGIPLASGQIHAELLFCSYTSMGILVLMVLSVLSLFLWGRKLPHLPRTPNTVAGVISYVANGSGLGDEMDGLEVRSTRERDMMIKGWGKSYCYTRVMGADSMERWTVAAVR